MTGGSAENVAEDKHNGVDRQKVCPMLIRVFSCSAGRHNPLSEYGRKGKTPNNELHIYSWLDASFKELTNLLKQVNPDMYLKGTQLEFAAVFPDHKRPSFRSRVLAQTAIGAKGPDDSITLAQKKFQIGDYLDVAITFPRGGGHGRLGRH